MTGLDKIIAQINEDAEISATKIINEARAEARKITEAGKSEAKKITATLEERTKSTCTDILERGKSAAALYQRQILLTEKQKIIADVLEKAYSTLVALPDNEYFSFLLRLVKKHSTQGEGVIFFNEKDLKRLPIIFGTELDKASNSKLSISETPKNIDGGFILSYGGIEENCSLRAIFEEQEDSLQDIVNNLLFA